MKDEATPKGTDVPELAKRQGRGRMPRMQELGLVFVILIMGIILWSASGNAQRTLPRKEIKDANGNVVQVLERQAVTENKFLSPGNLMQTVLVQMSWTAVMAVGLTIVIISGGIDISVGSIQGLSAMGCAAAVLMIPPDSPWYVALPVAIGVPVLIGIVCGALNGALVVGLRMHPFIVTLATMRIIRGILNNSATMGTLPAGDEVFPPAFTDRFIAWVYPMQRYGGRLVQNLEPVTVGIMLVVMALGWIYLRHMVWGRQTYAVGGNEEAARYSGISVGWAKMRVYIISGACAGVAGMMICGSNRSASTVMGNGAELYVIAGAVVGGASLTGGRGTALGAILGALVIAMIGDAVLILGPEIKLPMHFWKWDGTVPVRQEYNDIILGICILLAVAVDQISTEIGKRRLARAK